MISQEVLAVITITPALAWFVNAFVYMFKEYRRNEEKIHKVAEEGTTQIKEGAKQLKETVEKEVTTLKEKVQPNDSPHDDQGSPAESGTS